MSKKQGPFFGICYIQKTARSIFSSILPAGAAANAPTENAIDSNTTPAP
jgi:hypothetical protein